MKNEEIPFWENEKGKIRISHTKLITFLEYQGFSKVEVSPNNFLTVRTSDNKVKTTSSSEIIEVVKDYLIQLNELDVYELFARGLTTYVSNSKQELLKTTAIVNDHDAVKSSTFYFENCYCKIDKNGIELKKYSELSFPIWESRIIKSEFEFNENVGQFETFVMNISKNSESRFESLKSIIGYLLHRNKEKGESKAIIFYDENMGQGSNANGGTGKTLISKAIAKCRECVEFNGKEMKTGSFFRNQRINFTTDIVIYDDLNKNVDFEDFFTTITSGIEVEKKGKQSFFIDNDKSPKILMSSNYPVKGPGGSSDERRRFEFEIANHYDADFTPELEFGNRFFDKSWSSDEWNKFYFFMMMCVVTYLDKGLIEVEHINLAKNKISYITDPQFEPFIEANVKVEEWYDKREIEAKYNEFSNSDLTSHMFAKYLNFYCQQYNRTPSYRSTDGKYLFQIKSNN